MEGHTPAITLAGGSYIKASRAALLLGVSRGMLLRKIESGELAAYRIFDSAPCMVSFASVVEVLNRVRAQIEGKVPLLKTPRGAAGTTKRKRHSARR